jgi:hypothetical protein
MKNKSPLKQTRGAKRPTPKHPDRIQHSVFRGPKDVPTVPYTQSQIDTMSQKSYDKLPMFFQTLDESKKSDTIVNKVKGSKKPTPLKKKDACYRKAKAKYDVFPSAYASGYIAKCRKRKGNIG